MQRSWHKYLAFLAGTVLLISTQARATLVLPVSVDQMARESEVIVHGQVTEQRVTWSDDKARILTLSTIRVLSEVKGARKGDVLTLYQVGGSIDGITTKIVGACQFDVGEEIVLFGMRFEGKVVTYGMGLGKYLVTELGNTKMVQAQFGDVSFVRRAVGGRLVKAEPPDFGPKPLTPFLAHVQNLARGSP